MLSKSQRQAKILEFLKDTPSLTSRSLAETLDVSEMTIRRDIKELDSKGYVTSYYGGISLSTDFSSQQQHDVSTTKRNEYFLGDEKHMAEKQRIAKYACSLIEPQDAVAIDNGTTCCHMLDYANENTSCLIYTYSYLIMDKIVRLQNENLRLFVLGGYFHSNIKMFEYSEVINLINKIHINKLFLGAAGVSTKYGLSCPQPYEIPIRKALIKNSDQIILLADSSKIGKSWFDHYAELDEIDMMITDSGITEEQIQEIRAHNVDLRIV